MIENGQKANYEKKCMKFEYGRDKHRDNSNTLR